MRILHIVEATFAGVGRHVLDLIGAQAVSGHDVHVVYSPVRESGSFAAERADLRGVTWHELAMSRTLGAGDARAFRRARQIVADVEPDLIHGHSTKGGLLARLVSAGQPVVYTPNAVYSMNPTLNRRLRSAVKWVEKRLAARTSMIIAVSPEEQAHLVDEIGIDPSRIRLVPNGIQPVEPVDPTEVRRELGLPGDKAIVGFVGRLDGQKAPDDLLEINALVAAEVPDAHFVVVGEGPMRADLEARWTVGDSPLSGRIDFVGEQPGTWAMSGMDLLILPSRYEGFPYVLIEAAHLGVPIVTTNEACASLLVGGPAAVSVGRTGEIEQLARFAIDSLANAGPAGSRRDRRFTVEEMSSAVDRIYDTLCNPSAASADFAGDEVRPPRLESRNKG